MEDRLKMDEKPDIIKVGWREWLALPKLQIPAIKAKVDTGARTSALHAFFVEPFEQEGRQMVRFGVHPLQKRQDLEIICEAPVKDFRSVSDSGGHRDMRYVIETTMTMGDIARPIEITLTNRDNMKFRMLLGRTAMKGLQVAPDMSYLMGRRPYRYRKEHTSL
jgi:hypothetical protein